MARAFDLYSILAITHRLPSTGETYQEIVGFMLGRPFSPSTVDMMFGSVDACREE
jgi:hypothetical protein